MQETSFDEFNDMISGVYEYYGKSLTDFSLMMWWDGLQRYEMEDVQRALRAHAATPDVGRFLPKIADITKFLMGSGGDRASIAWSKVDEAIRKVGTYQDVVFDDPIIHAVVSYMGGWVVLGSKDDNAWPFVQKEFETRYKGYAYRNEHPKYPPVLIGISNTYNNQKGFKGQEPVMIGDKAKAEAVRMGGSDAPKLQFHQAVAAGLLQ